MARYLQWLTVPFGAELRVVAVSEILVLEADPSVSVLSTAVSRFAVPFSFADLRRKLDPDVFWPISAKTLINSSAIDTLYRSFSGAVSVKMRGRGELLLVSAAYTHLFEPD